MRRYINTEIFYGIFLIVFTFFGVLALLNSGITVVLKHFGFQFNNPNTLTFINGSFIIAVVLIFIFYARVKEYILQCIDIIFNKNHCEALLNNFKNDLQVKRTNYLKLKKSIDEIDKIL